MELARGHKCFQWLKVILLRFRRLSCCIAWGGLLWRGRFIGECCLRVVGLVGIYLQSCKRCVGGFWFSCGVASAKGILGLRGEEGTRR